MKGVEKVPDEIAKLGIGWSDYLDWFAIFFRVDDAIIFVDLLYANLTNQNRASPYPSLPSVAKGALGFAISLAVFALE